MVGAGRGIPGFQQESQRPAQEGGLSRLILGWAFPGGADAVQHGAERGQEPVAREYLDPDLLPAHLTGNGAGKWDWEIRPGNLTGKWEGEICPRYQTGNWYWEV